MTTDVLEQLQRSQVTLAWVRAGFSRAEAAAWNDAGWTDPEAAARWRSTAPLADPTTLHELSTSGCAPEQVTHTARFAPTYAAAWARACAGTEASDDMGDEVGDDGETPQRRRSDGDPLEAMFTDGAEAGDSTTLAV